MPSDLEKLMGLLTMADEHARLRDENVQLRASCALWQRYYEQALLRLPQHHERPTTRRQPARLTT